MPGVIHAEGLVKTFGGVRALDGVDLDVQQGTVLGLLGPNGAGKTTTVRALTTLIRPDSGTATVAGYDVLREPERVRASIGLAGQYAAVDEYLTGRENLQMVGELYQLRSREAAHRADQLLERFNLTEAGGRPVKTYSGGMRRRLDLAASLIVHPPVIFLDEPTTGLDPRSRIGLWEIIHELVDEGTTLLLTTQYLEEADQLAHSIAVVDHGRVIARGTSDELKAQVGGERVEVVVLDPAELSGALAATAKHAVGEAHVEQQAKRVVVPVSGGAGALADIIRDLDVQGIRIADIALRRPTLDDVFLALTGHAAEDERTPPAGGTATPTTAAGGRAARKENRA
ncbi:ATP-binding cassette domain-containing protein [Allostreptomyces psammosilenae]|uniref:ABC-type xenobiotic transporter n=1 Tax=Allostreptomyces psammosilenae TaxID=1892865 RepID=A0A852ZUV3_9ACTN|nr:ATP-binding cassette domain-containing protein [Allostreptomyces psammosilenae]NYI06049.1 ABC-2 type transport system ATP-binding protein [Allostreptomyces psammosilenae]